MKKRAVALFLVMFSILSLSACDFQLTPAAESPSPEISVAPAPSESPSPTPTLTPEPTPSPSPTATPAPFEITQTLYEVFQADDGTLLMRNEWWQPVFSGGSPAATAINAVFTAERADDSEYAGMADSAKSDSDVYNMMIQNAKDYSEVGGTYVKYDLTYADNGVYSFYAQEIWDYYGPHPYAYDLAHTFDAATGAELKITDVLSVDAGSFDETIYQEYLAYHANDSFHDLAVETPDAIKGIAPGDTVFYLAGDGVHICFGQYTFYYAAGSSELVIPYSRGDLLRAPFAS